jgi:hypothetical protein
MGGDNPGEVFAKTSDKGVKGVLPLRCLPHWGREGVTLTSVGECMNNGRNRISPDQKKAKITRSKLS